MNGSHPGGKPQTRLDRLLNLLSTGQTLSVRTTAAQQLGAIAHQRIQHGHQEGSIYAGTEGNWQEIAGLLHKLLPVLKSKSNDARSAAASAVDQICSSVGIWDPTHAESSVEATSTLSESAGVQDTFLSLAEFNLHDIMTKEQHLLGSSGSEYTQPGSAVESDKAHKDILTDLGLGGPAGDDLDFDIKKELDEANLSEVKQDTKPIVKVEPEIKEEEQDLSHLSARERNALKRKRKKEQSNAPPAKLRKTESPAPSNKASPSLSEASTSKHANAGAPDEDSGPVVISHQPRAAKVEPTNDQVDLSDQLPPHLWPFTKFVSELAETLTDPSWVVRHGAALGLAAILPHQGAHGGKELGLTNQDNTRRHAAWTEHLACRLLKLLALDRFGDYVGDTVLAPVREAASTALAMLLDIMNDEGREAVHKLLVWMVTQEGLPPSQKGGKKIVWQVRHSGLLGLRSLVSGAVERKRVFEVQPLRELVSVGLLGLQDTDDDVKSAAAATLIPLTEQIVQTTPDLIAPILEVLWVCLSDLKDDLSSSVSNVMTLLSRLLGHQPVCTYLESQAPGRNLADVPLLLFPYFRHIISSVRLCVVDTIALMSKLQLPPSRPSPLADRNLFSLLFQNLLLESKPDILAVSQDTMYRLIPSFANSGLLASVLSKPVVQNWFDLATTPLGRPLSVAAMYRPSGVSGEIDAAALRQDMTLLDENHVIRGRLAAIQIIAFIISHWPVEEIAQLDTFVLPVLNSSSYFKAFCAAALISECFKALASRSEKAPPPIIEVYTKAISPLLEISSAPVYDELAPHFQAICQDCDTLMKLQKKGGKANTKAKREALNESLARTLGQKDLSKLSTKLDQLSKSDLVASEESKDRATKICVAIQRYRMKAELLEVRVNAGRAGALVALGVIPSKLTPTIKGFMSSIKMEPSPELQELSASDLASFIVFCSKAGAALKTNPSDKITKNLCSFLCQDPQETPLFDKVKTSTRPIWAPVDELDDQPPSETPQENKNALLTRRGAEMAIQALSRRLGDQLFLQQPKLKSCMEDALKTVFSKDVETADGRLASSDQIGQDCIDALSVLPVVSKHIHNSLRSNILDLLPLLFTAVKSRYSAVRSCAARSVALICAVYPVPALHDVVVRLLPSLGDMDRLDSRRGVIEVISNLVKQLDTTLLPFILFFLVPTLGRTTDPDPAVRNLATLTFAKLVRLVPLEAGYPDPPDFPQDLLGQKDKERRFLSQLLNGTKAELYEIPVQINAELRSYQREGVSWLAFLAKYKLHGILCDDMGLGKTLQTICILASVTHERQQQFEATGSPEYAHRPSLVVCPPTLVSHWAAEVEQYAPSLRVQQLVGNLTRTERLNKIKKSKNVDVFVTSYEILRNDIRDLASVNWTYCILDEGHIIKNPKTKMSQAVKKISATHRLILSGTPVQNHVLELWSLFDFLMPGFLGTEKAFNERFSKPIKASRDAKTSSKEQAAGTLALESLHKQVLPFVLRRLKEDVLDDLPPKIIQDYYCELSRVQKVLYERSSDTDEDSPHVFQTLQYMRKLVNHPLLVMDPSKEEDKALSSELNIKNPKDLHDIGNAPKLEALKQILNDCGIGIKTEAPDALGDEAVAPHRVLVFCQMRQMLDIIEEDLFRVHMPDVTYMRLDGTVAANKRHAVVQTFNSDPSIDVLLLTTSVGGLGLTLTGADTVIFVEHDWNPMKDLQAMDRAHRLGQKRVVNVYRLITRGTLEEKIMGLQKFKLNIASSVVNDQNTAMGSMETDQVLDLFDTPAPEQSKGKAKSGSSRKMSRKALLEGLGELEEIN